MTQRRNEMQALTRPEPFKYRAAYDASSNVEYEGYAVPGSDTAEAVWLICKHTYSSSNLTQTDWAGGADFTQIWDNRASLSYS